MNLGWNMMEKEMLNYTFHQVNFSPLVNKGKSALILVVCDLFSLTSILLLPLSSCLPLPC